MRQLRERDAGDVLLLEHLCHVGARRHRAGQHAIEIGIGLQDLQRVRTGLGVVIGVLIGLVLHRLDARIVLLQPGECN